MYHVGTRGKDDQTNRPINSIGFCHIVQTIVCAKPANRHQRELWCFNSTPFSRHTVKGRSTR